MVNIFWGILIIGIVGASSVYIWNEKKKGSKCIGCPYASGCTSCKSCSGAQFVDKKTKKIHRVNKKGWNHVNAYEKR